MTHATAPVGLLADAVWWTRDALEVAASTDPRAPTPCHDWDLRQLLAHMADGLDAFAEASGGFVAVERAPLAGDPVTDLCSRACAVLASWRRSTPESVRVADVELPADVLLHTAALEITVHGWDVARACGLPGDLPAKLATALLPAAALLVTRSDRPGRFAPALPTAYGAGPSERLLALLGRRA